MLVNKEHSASVLQQVPGMQCQSSKSTVHSGYDGSQRCIVTHGRAQFIQAKAQKSEQSRDMSAQLSSGNKIRGTYGEQVAADLSFLCVTVTQRHCEADPALTLAPHELESMS